MQSKWLAGCAVLAMVSAMTSATAHADPPPEPALVPVPEPSREPAREPAPVPALGPCVTPLGAVPTFAPCLSPPGSIPPTLVDPMGNRVDRPDRLDGGELETTTSYRWQIAAADAAALTLGMTGRANTLQVGLLIYVLDGVVIHGAHGEGGRALASLALRLGLPVIGTYVGHTVWWRSQDPRCRAGDYDYCTDDEVDPGALLGLGIGILTAMVADTAFLARPQTVRKPRAATWTPRVSATHDRVTLGFSARF